MSLAKFVDDFNRFFQGDASLEVEDTTLKVSILSRTMVIELPKIVGVQAKASSCLEPSGTHRHTQ